eukprot:1788043-Heterocapsa_arctica.AAC.1
MRNPLDAIFVTSQLAAGHALVVQLPDGDASSRLRDLLTSGRVRHSAARLEDMRLLVNREANAQSRAIT